MVYDEDNRQALELGLVESTVAWGSLLHLEFRQHSLQLWRPSLTIRRDSSGQVHVAGISLAKNKTGDGRAADWLLAQQEISIRDADVTWIDDQRAAPPLSLAHVEFLLENTGARHRFALQAQPPRQHASLLEIKGDVHGYTASDLDRWRGRVYANLEFVDLAAWREWVDYPLELRQGRGGIRVWAEFKSRELISLVADAGLADVVARAGPNLPLLELSQLQGRFQSKYSDSGYMVAGTGVNLRAKSGLEMGPEDFSVKLSRAPAKPGGELRANGVDLQKLAQMAEFLPLDPALHRTLATYAPEGKVFGLGMTWAGPLDKPQNFKLQSRFSDLGVRAGEGTPGFSGLSGELRADETGGTLVLDSHAAAIELTGVFNDPRILLETLSAKLAWRNPASGIEINIGNLEFANADGAGSVSGTYRTVAGSRGYVDITARLTRADVRQVARYLPARLKENVHLWTARALLGGTSNNAHLKLKGDLAHFPFDDEKEGVFEFSANVLDGRLAYAEAWPHIDNIAAAVVFRGRRLEVDGTQGTILGARIGRTKVEIPDLLDLNAKVLNIVGTAEGPTAEFLRFIEASPVSGLISHFTRDMRAIGNGKLQLKMSLPLPLAKPKIAGNFQFLSNEFLPHESMPPISQLTGRLEFTEGGISARNITGMFSGGPATVNVITRPDAGILATAAGTMNAQTLQRALELPWEKKLSGTTPWRSTIALKSRVADIVFESTLVGITSELPDPMRKLMADSLPLRIERHSAPGEPARDGTPVRLESMTMSLGKIVSGQWAYRRTSAGVENLRGNLAINEVASAPARGLLISGRLAALDIDQWRELTVVTSATKNMDGVRVDLKFGVMDVLGRRLNEVDFRSSFQDGTWRSNIKSREMEGDIDWRPRDQGQVTARMKQFTLPEVSPYAQLRAQKLAADAATANVAASTAATSAATGAKPREAKREGNLPDLDLIAENFVVKQHNLGRVEFTAANAGRDWNIQKLLLSNDDGLMRADGVWQNDPSKPLTRINLHLESNDIGKLLDRVGYPGTMRRGQATMDAKLAWSGSPQSFDYPTLDGNLILDAKRGQFSKIEPGIGKLLGILSLQSLPRRLTLDFRDVFSDGFAFDQIVGNVDIARGVMATSDLKIDGPAAKVQIKGIANLVNETQNLRVKVLPTIGEGVSLLGYFLINPLVGITSLVAQKVFKDPLSEFLSYEYAVSGTWDDPKVEKLRGPQPLLPETTAAPGPAPGAPVPVAPKGSKP